MSEKDKNQSFIQLARKDVYSKVPIINVTTFEDQRCVDQLRELSKKGFQKPFAFYVWSSTEGLVDENGKAVPNTLGSIEALDFVMKANDSSLFAFKDFYKEFSDNPKLLRKLRDVYQQLKTNYKTLFYISPTPSVPFELSKEVNLLEFSLPNVLEIEKLLHTTLGLFSNVEVKLTDIDKDDIVKSALGLTYDEARQAFQVAFIGKKVLDRDCIKTVMEEKCKVVKKEGVLEYVDIDFNMEEIGGLNKLKSWLEMRTKFFTKNAREFGITPPKGILLTGISGCGKSSCVKAISQYWRLPLMRLDMTKVYGGTLGNPEETMRRVLQTIEAVAPVILWIEEIEKGVAGFAQGDAGVTARIFSSFLTWMQEKESLVFVAATANEINQLPPELLRKGRFDEIFFVDLPTENERQEIFKVHITKRKHDPATFKLDQLAKATNGFSGAEIEQVVASGMYSAFNEQRKFNDQDLYKEISRTVPLATTMSEQIKSIKRWADTRAVKAS
ncbi:MAG: AAA family ATPase [Bdellovibrionales bacterium]|nr:AAA family ATPase [Bdellovibrionales bacterium]